MLIGSFAGVELGAVLTGAGARLQAALVVLGRLTKDTTLSAVKVDGAPGAKTASAASRAFQKYVTGAPAAYKKLTTAKAKSMAATLAMALETEIRKRGGQPAAPATVASSQIVTRAAKKTAPKVAAKKKAVVKKTKAVKKAGTAKAKAAIAKGNAARMKAMAAHFRKKGLKSVADKYDQYAATEETKAVEAAQEAGESNAEAVKAEITAQAATESIAQDTAQAVAEQGPAAAAAATTAAVPNAGPAPDAAPEAMTPAAESAVQPSGEGSESFFARNKIAIIAGIGIAAVVGGVIVYKRKKKGLQR